MPQPPDTKRPTAARPRSAPASWLEAHGDALYAYAYRRLSAHDEAEDAVQDCLLAALSASRPFEGRSQERSWLIGILKHKVLDRLRSRYREARRAEELRELLATGSENFHQGVWRQRQEPWGDGPEGEELRRLVARRLEGLPDAMRTALLLREIDGLGSGEVCDILGVTPTNLWTIVHRAKARLRKELRGDLLEGRASDSHGTTSETSPK